MASLSNFFQKRSKQQKQKTLSSLFSNEQNKKFQNLATIQPQPVTLTKPQQKKQHEPQNLDSTIFVGNVPVTSNKKTLKNLFNKYGKIQKIWFRSIPVQQNKLNIKANVVLKKIKQSADSMNAYIKFAQQSHAIQACKQNGVKIEDHTLRVFLCNDDNMDYQTTIFVGNLPLDIKQQEFRKHFEQSGQIVNVRVIKDKRTFVGIGIGYVRFANKQQMFNCIRTMNGSMLKNRPLRVKRAVQKQKLQKKSRKLFEKKMNKKGYTPSRQQKKIWRSSNNKIKTMTQDEKKQQARKFHFRRKFIKK